MGHHADHGHGQSGALDRTMKEMLPTSREGWHRFTKFVVIGCVSVAVVLLGMLLFLY
jgi:hypothetical protein